MRTSIVALAMLFVVSVAGISGQGGSSADEQVIRGLLDQVVAAWNKADAKAYAQFVSEDYEGVSPAGVHTKGRAAFEKVQATAFAARKGTEKLTATTVTVKFLKPDVALASGTWAVTGAAAGPANGSWTITYLKQGGKWLNTGGLVATLPPPPPPTK